MAMLRRLLDALKVSLVLRSDQALLEEASPDEADRALATVGSSRDAPPAFARRLGGDASSRPSASQERRLMPRSREDPEDDLGCSIRRIQDPPTRRRSASTGASPPPE